MAMIVRVEESDQEIFEDLDRNSGLCVTIVTSRELKQYRKQLREENDLIIIED